MLRCKKLMDPLNSRSIGVTLTDCEMRTSRVICLLYPKLTKPFKQNKVTEKQRT